MKVGTDLKEMFKAIYPNSSPENVFQSGNAGLALAGHYIAEAIKAYAQTQADTHLSFQKAQQEDQSNKLQAKVDDLQLKLSIAEASLKALEARHYELLAHHGSGDQAPRQPVTGTPVATQLQDLIP